jgi:hypothetical protein
MKILNFIIILLSLYIICICLTGCSGQQTTYSVPEFTSDYNFVINKITKIEDNKNMYECTYKLKSNTFISYKYSRIIGPIGFHIGDTLILFKNN